MKNAHFAKGVIPIAFSFIIVISITLAVLIGLFWHRVPLSASSLKRFQGINYAEAALYETFNRFRSTVSPYHQWDADAWAEWNQTGGASGFIPVITPDPTSGAVIVDTADTSNYPTGQPIVRFTTIYGGTLDVEIEVVPDAATGRNKVSAIVDYEDVKL